MKTHLSMIPCCSRQSTRSLSMNRCATSLRIRTISGVGSISLSIGGSHSFDVEAVRRFAPVGATAGLPPR